MYWPWKRPAEVTELQTAALGMMKGVRRNATSVVEWRLVHWTKQKAEEESVGIGRKNYYLQWLPANGTVVPQSKMVRPQRQPKVAELVANPDDLPVVSLR